MAGQGMSTFDPSTLTTPAMRAVIRSLRSASIVTDTRNRSPKIGKLDLGFCSICEKYRICLGDHRRGGIRYCPDCITATFGWFQITNRDAEAADRILKPWNAAESESVIVELLQSVNGNSDLLKSVSIGESRVRLLKASLEESRG